MKRTLLVFNVIAILSTSSYAACLKPPVFSCTTTRDKLIEVCDIGDSFEYSFGKVGKVEKSIKQSKQSTKINPISGGYGCGSIEFPSGNTLYSINSCADKYGKQSGGIEVRVNGKRVADIECDEKKEITDNMTDYEAK
jgi:hypothetical protein